MTVKIDISKIKQSKQKIYPTMLYYLTKTVNQYEQFRTFMDENNNICIFDKMSPCYTVFHEDTETFSNIWTQYHEDYDKFLNNYNEDIHKFGSVHKFNAKPNIPANTFPVSMIPWETFDSFNLNLQKGYTYLLPIFTMGKYYCENGKYFMPLSIQVHHAVCDGFHLCKFIKQLKSYLE